MLEKSFLHLPGIGPQTEEKLWGLGLSNWQTLSENLTGVFGAKKAMQLAQALEESEAALDAGEFEYFQTRLKGSQIWRLVPNYFRQDLNHKIAYLDIETTGLGFPPESHSTTIAVLFGGKLYLEHDRKKKFELLQMINSEARLMVTFNGICFDLPFLRREYGLTLGQPHLDLRYWFRDLGLSGGLKKIQKALPEVHQRVSMDIDGFDAVKLWRLHKAGVPNALDTLYTYNAEDTIVLEQLVYSGLNMESKRRSHLHLPDYRLPTAPLIPYYVCPKVYRMIRGEYDLY